MATGVRALRTVVLRHAPGSGESHFDWFLARPGDGHPHLIAWKLTESPAELAPGTTCRLTRNFDHRSVWLDDRPPRSSATTGDMIERIAAGSICGTDHPNEPRQVDIRWDDGRLVSYRIVPDPPGGWTLHSIPVD